MMGFLPPFFALLISLQHDLIAKKSRGPVRNLIFSLIAFSICGIAHADTPVSASTLHIQNRVLINVLNKPISVLDVVKKMNVILEKAYPEYKNIPEARYQFYRQQWKSTLLQMVDSELMLKDAEKLELKITNGDIRQEIHDRFGPDIMKSLNAIGITYEEAQEMIRSDLITQRMMWYRVHSKALTQVGPQSVRNSYLDYLKKNPSNQIWTYEVLSVRSPDQATGEKLASKAFNMLSAAKMGLKEAASSIEAEVAANDKVKMNVSEIVTVKDQELSDAHKKALSELQVGQYSDPIEQVSKNNQEKVYRVFHLLGKEKKDPEAFNKLAEDLKEKLLQEQVAEFNKTYILKLRSRYGFNDLSFLDKIEPFSLSS